ncbi:MAG TPA: hypothetical protein VIM70_20465 [Clostridium sp.]|uniref:hypothetical protein n=1 Tax=Clostridium sp. TaxID=1506 RepID=UPI002F9211B2
MTKIIYKANITFKITENINTDKDSITQKNDMDNNIREMIEDNIDMDRAEYEITINSTLEKS